MDLNRPDGVPLKAGISYSDLLGSSLALVAVLAALEYRDRVGPGQLIDLSMQDITAWTTRTTWNRATPDVSATVLECRDGFVVAEPGPDGPVRIAADALRNSNRADAAKALTGMGYAAAPVLTIPEVLESKQTEAREIVVAADLDGESVPLLASPIRLSLSPVQAGRPSPALGADNADILDELATTAGQQPGHGKQPRQVTGGYR